MPALRPMIRGKTVMRVDPTYVTNLVSSLDSVQSQQQSLSSELSSGMRLNSLSDDPVASGENVRLLNQIQQDDTFTSNSSLVSGQLQVADSTLGQVVTQLTSAVTLATSANNGTMNSSDVKSVATQLSGILSEVVTLANTNYQGQYIFGGTVASEAPFSLSSSTVTYNGNSGVNYLTTPNGQQIQLNVPGDQIFQGSGDSSQSVFAALSNLISDYSSGTVDTGAAATDTSTLSTALNYVSQQRVTIDNSITQLTAAGDAISSTELQLSSAQTDLVQADVASVSTQLSLTESQQTALEDVIAELNSTSNTLFSKL